MRLPPAPEVPLRRPRWRPALGVVAAVLALHLMVASLWHPPRAGWLRGAQAMPAPALQVRRVLLATAAPAATLANNEPGSARPPTLKAAEGIPRPVARPDAVREPLPAPAVRLAQAAEPAAARSVAPMPAPDTAPAQAPSPQDSEGEAADSVPAGEPDAVPPPLYATRPPASAVLDFVLRRGPLGGRARLRWQNDGGRYTLDFDARLAGLPLMEQHSVGELGGHGLAPEQFTDRRRGRSAQAAHFRRDTGRISFSGPRVDYPAWPGAQDRLGWVVQLAAIHAAAETPPAEVTLFVVGARGGAALWTFRSLGPDTLQTPLGPVVALRLQREPTQPEDLRAEVWLDPARGHWPVRIRTVPARGGEPLDLLLAAEPARP